VSYLDHWGAEGDEVELAVVDLGLVEMGRPVAIDLAVASLLAEEEDRTAIVRVGAEESVTAVEARVEEERPASLEAW
jgi:hypothetical protein